MSTTGVLSSRFMDQYAPTVLDSRTVHTAFARKYSHSFQMNEMHGHYSGLDSVTLCDKGRYDQCTSVSIRKDSVAIACRPDLVTHVSSLAEQKIIPRWLAVEKLETGISETEVNNMKKMSSMGSTFMSLEDAIMLDKKFRFDPGKSVRVTSEDGSYSEVHFVPPWPDVIVHVHRNDEFGAEMPLIPKFESKKFDSRMLWCLCTMLCHIPEFWINVCGSVHDTKQWFGWILMLACNKCFSHLRGKGSRINPFKKRANVDDVIQKHMCDWFQPQFDLIDLSTAFIDLNCIVAHDMSVLSQSGFHLFDENVKVIVLYRPFTTQHLNDYEIQDSLILDDGNWELRTMIKTVPELNWEGHIHSRHGKLDFTKWWYQKRSYRKVSKVLGEVPHNVRKSCDIAVYVKREEKSTEDLCLSYLQCCGGQTWLRCSHHRRPLVQAALNSNKMCARCNEHCHYVCPYFDCTCCLCKNHCDEIKDATDLLYLDPINIVGDFNVDNDDMQVEPSNNEFNYGSDGNVDDNDDCNSVNLEMEIEEDEDVVSCSSNSTISSSSSSSLSDSSYELSSEDDDDCEIPRGFVKECTEDTLPCKYVVWFIQKYI